MDTRGFKSMTSLHKEKYYTYKFILTYKNLWDGYNFSKNLMMRFKEQLKIDL